MNKLPEIIAEMIDRPLDPAVAVMAEAVRVRHGSGIAAILAYGSCLRDQSVSDSLIDFYILSDDFTAISKNRISQLGCRLIPPNVYYAETQDNGTVLRCKYAVLPLAQFTAKMAPNIENPYFWARFAQPCALVYARDEAARTTVMTSLARAITTFLGEARTLSPHETDPLQIWITAMKATYGTELRAEAPDRAAQIVGFNEGYYRQCAELVTATTRPANWPLRRIQGKLWSIARLLKAAFTFQGGADYLAWKISRHSGHQIPLSDWQRRHPILASLYLLPQLLRKGAVK